jgi:excisionase family DNA binding protein
MSTTYLSLSEVAQELSLTRYDVRRIIKNGSLPGYEFGKEIRVKAVDLSSYIERSRMSIPDPNQAGER